MKKFLCACLVSLVTLPVLASQITISTGDMSNIRIDAGETFGFFFTLDSPSNTEESFMDVKFGMANGGSIPVSAFVNDIFVGIFTPSTGYVIPGPEYATLSTTGALLDGENKFSFLSEPRFGNYILGQVDLTYYSATPSPVPVPAAAWLFGSGLLGLAGMRKRMQAKAA